MKVICSWCSTLIREDDVEPKKISHGICENCYSDMMSKKTGTLQSFLDQFEFPVFNIDQTGKALWCNNAAEKLTGKEKSAIQNQLGGDIFECVHSFKEGGCGNTIHCKACTIRNLVNKTYETEVSQFNVPAFLKVKPQEAEMRFDCLITTIFKRDKNGSPGVLLCVEDH